MPGRHIQRSPAPLPPRHDFLGGFRPSLQIDRHGTSFVRLGRRRGVQDRPRIAHQRLDLRIALAFVLRGLPGAPQWKPSVPPNQSPRLLRYSRVLCVPSSNMAISLVLTSASSHSLVYRPLLPALRIATALSMLSAYCNAWRMREARLMPVMSKRV